MTPTNNVSNTHVLFQSYPITSRARILTGDAPTPYHIYNGYGVFIGGTADLAATQALLQPEAVQPVQTTDGRALMGIWVCDFTEASLGPHHELQFSIFVARDEVRDISPRPLGLLAAMLTRPDVMMMCHGLWNNTPTVVAYNREVLSLNARLAESCIARSGNGLTFDVTDADTGASVLSGMLSNITSPTLKANLELMSLTGMTRLMALGRQPWLSMSIVNPRGVLLDHNAVAQALTKPAATAVRSIDPKIDRLTFGAGSYARLGFTPCFLQGMTGFKFVYLNPDKAI
jgi:hypothetical protein